MTMVLNHEMALAHLQGGLDALHCVQTFIDVGGDGIDVDDVHELIVQFANGLTAEQARQWGKGDAS